MTRVLVAVSGLAVATVAVAALAVGTLSDDDPDVATDDVVPTLDGSAPAPTPGDEHLGRAPVLGELDQPVPPSTATAGAPAPTTSVAKVRVTSPAPPSPAGR